MNLVERDTTPGGYQLVDPDKSGKKTQMDLGKPGRNSIVLGLKRVGQGYNVSAFS